MFELSWAKAPYLLIYLSVKTFCNYIRFPFYKILLLACEAELVDDTNSYANN